MIFSDPWTNGQQPLENQCQRKNQRELGSVFMFFFRCPYTLPGSYNCGKLWANNHVYGMDGGAPIYGNGPYTASNPEFWIKEFQDAVYGGYQFLLPNMYGGDIDSTIMGYVNNALEQQNGQLKLGLMDDTWMWGEPWEGPQFSTIPNLNDPQTAATTLYTTKWKLFFSLLNRQHWYLVEGRPFIYFYNAGKLTPRELVTPVVGIMKQMFFNDFGIVPFVSLDVAFPAGSVADSTFLWYTFDVANSVYFSPIYSSASSMIRWDPVGRDRPGSPSNANDFLVKGPERLRTALSITSNSKEVVLHTFNDLGEGTGINRAYDYYYRGQWLPPDYFLSITRQAQCA
jgi:hypothetical protein